MISIPYSTLSGYQLVERGTFNQDVKSVKFFFYLHEKFRLKFTPYCQEWGKSFCQIEKFASIATGDYRL